MYGSLYEAIGSGNESDGLGVTEDMLEGIADATLIMTGGYQVLTHEDVVAILKQAL